MKLYVFIAIVFTYVTCVWSFALHRHSVILRKSSGQVIRPYLNIRPNLSSYNHHIDSSVKLSAVKHTNQRFNPQTAENKITSGTSALIATNVFVYVMSLYDPKLISGFMKLNSRISKGETYRLLTSTFLHTDRYHLAMNCYSLYNMGKMAESVFGREKFLAIFLGSGAIANTITFALDTAPEAIGASDCICGIMGAMGMYAYRNKGRLGSGADSLMTFVKQGVVQTLLPVICGAGGTEHHGQLAGMIGGAMVELMVNPPVTTKKKSQLQVNKGPVRYLNIKKTSNI